MELTGHPGTSQSMRDALHGGSEKSTVRLRVPPERCPLQTRGVQSLETHCHDRRHIWPRKKKIPKSIRNVAIPRCS
eukprot:349479-Amphidinium_carterae.1